MRFFLRNITLSALILALFVGALSVYISGRIVYESTLNQIFNERVSVIKAFGKSALEGASQDTASTTTQLDPFLQSLLLDIGNNQPGTLEFRVINATNRTIIASLNEEEVGSIPVGEFPKLERGVVSVEIEERSEEQSVLELSYLGSENRFIWMTVDETFFSNPAVVVGVQQATVFAVAFGLFAFLFFGIIRKFFTRPVQKLKEVLSTAEGAQKNATVKKNESFGELLESFSDVAGLVESTIEHDKVVSETKSDFISTTAHQLRTPLSGINWALGSLLSNGANLTDEQKNLLERASEKTKELVGIVGELLSAAGIEQGKFGFHPEEVQLQTEIELTLKEEKELAAKNKVTLRFDHDEEAFPAVYVDKERIRWVIRNLIENAIRYGRENGEVVVTLKREGKKLLISVKDNGIGIAPEAQQHIFEKFFRSAEAKRKRNDGSGIGLFIVRNIVNYHGGRIWFESVEGVGTTFFFTIPTARDNPQKPEKNASGQNIAKAPSPTKTVTNQQQPLTTEKPSQKVEPDKEEKQAQAPTISTPSAPKKQPTPTEPSSSEQNAST